MTPEEHLDFINTAVDRDIRKKYHAGQEEHGGQLWRKPIMNYIGEEITDMVVYWYTFKEQWLAVAGLIFSIYMADDTPEWTRDRLLEVINLMNKGNKEGVMEEERNA